jgi:putative oxidoreductase
MSRIERPGARIARDFLISTTLPLRPGRDLAQYAPMVLRLIVGFGFMQHGTAKLLRGPDDFTQILHALHMPFPELLAWSTILIELLGGAAVLLGAFVTLASIPMAIVLLVAIFTVHLPYGFSSSKLLAITAAGTQFGQPGYETDLLYLAGLVALVLGGAGPWSVDGALRRRFRPEPDQWP